jgi:hypothetical protein
MPLKRSAAVEGNNPIIAEVNECIPKQSQEPRAVLAHGTKIQILIVGVVGLVIHVHLKTQP